MTVSRLDLFQQAVDADPSNELARFSLAGELLDAGRYEEALPHYAAALEAKPDWMRVHIQTAKCLLELGRRAEARAAAERALEILERSGDEENREEIEEILDSVRPAAS